MFSCKFNRIFLKHNNMQGWGWLTDFLARLKIFGNGG